ncbi:AraC family transcriptional regulator [Mycolicibacterium hodleri]|uniref:AraC family transcriptional regulator n=1 Tax=Mycolicibacterium hodleri TaxID=49897 RepID=UPI001127DA20|nr:AraC family transcriptional regulator [Mycolicibacterium hodleri]
MTADYPAMPTGLPFSTSRVLYAAGEYAHPPTGLIQLRLVRRGSSFADLDLGLGLHRVFTRPGDLLLSLPDRPTAFRIEDGRELTLLQVAPPYAITLLRQCGGGGLDDLTPLLRRPVRDPLIAEVIRRLETDVDASAPSRTWAVGVVFDNLLRLARESAATSRNARLSDEEVRTLVSLVNASLDESWPVQRIADEAGLPRRTFAAAFKAATGVPVHQYVVRLRCEFATELLRSTDLSIASIALQAGFASQAHLTRVVNRLMRTTPGQIRAHAESTE